MQKLILGLLIKTKPKQLIGKHTRFGQNTHLQSWFLCSDISSAEYLHCRMQTNLWHLHHCLTCC